jgi:hypothetical protein
MPESVLDNSSASIDLSQVIYNPVSGIWLLLRGIFGTDSTYTLELIFCVTKLNELHLEPQ